MPIVLNDKIFDINTIIRQVRELPWFIDLKYVQNIVKEICSALNTFCSTMMIENCN